MIRVTTAELIHNKLIDEFSGSKGIRDKGLLEASLARPFATFDTEDLYPTPIDKASAFLKVS